MRARTLPIGVVTAFALGLSVSAQVLVRTFDDDKLGAPPAGFTFTMTRQTTPGTWLVRGDAETHYLVHDATSADSGGQSLAVLPAMVTDATLAVRIKLTGGDRVGGLVWGYQNPDNFYAAMLDLTQQEIALYRVVNGNRVRLEREDDLELDPEAWHSIRLEHTGDRVRLTLGGIGVIRTRERSLASTGQVGVWSGGGSTAAFDDLRIGDSEEGRRRASARR